MENIQRHERIFKHLLPMRTENKSRGQNTRTRRKRGLVDGVGKGMKYLFGTAVDEDVQVMKAHLKFAATSYKKIKSYQHYLNSYLIKTNKRVDNAIHMLNFNHEILQHAINNITEYRRKVSERLAEVQEKTETVVKLTKFSSAVVLRMSQVIDQLGVLLHHGERKLHAVQRLLDHKLPLQLVTPSDLRKMTRDIQREISRNHAAFRITVRDVSEFYSESSVSYAMSEEYLAIHVKVPISNLKSEFKVYQTIVTSSPLTKNATHNGNRTTQIVNSSPYLAITEDDSLYAELSDLDYTSCSSSPFKICQRPLTLRPVNQNHSCSVALYFGHHDDIMQWCEIRYLGNAVPEPLTYPLGNGSHLIRTSGLVSWTRVCQKSNLAKRQEEILAPCQFCIVDNHCCELQGENFYLPLQIETCTGNNYTTTIKLIPNIPFLSLFSDNITHDNSSDTVEEYEEITMVDMNSIDQRWGSALAQDRKDRTDLELLGWLISESTMDTIDETTDQTFIFERYSGYILGTLTTFGVLLFGAYVLILILVIKIRRMNRNQHGRNERNQKECFI